MSTSLAEYLKAIAPDLPKELFSATALSKMQQIGRKLPTTWAISIGCSLGTDATSVTFSLPLPEEIDSLPIKTESFVLLPQIRRLCLDCVNPQSRLGKAAASFWLNFNLQQEKTTLYLCMPEGELQSVCGDLATFYSWLTEKLLEPLFDRTIPLELAKNFQLSLYALPPQAQVIDVGVILNDRAETIRMKVSGIPLQLLSVYLTKIGWSGNVEHLEAIAARVENLIDRVVLKFDIGVTISPQISLECYLDRYLEEHSQWLPLLNYLIENQLCTPEKSKDLLTCAIGELNYIELTLQPQNQLEAKGYLWFNCD
jgi:hypothetical protein